MFIASRSDWRAIARTLWIPGIILYLAVMLPWYLAVQLRNPEFFRVFILEHNLARFSQDVYHHRQPFWFYLPVFLLATMPWTFIFIAAVVERVGLIWSKGKQAFARPEDSWPTFLLIWMLVPILFFSASQSKLPGYILPAVPAGALLAAEYIAARRRGKDVPKFSFVLAAAHGILCGALVFVAFSAASILTSHHLLLRTQTYVALAIGLVAALVIGIGLLSSAGLRLMSRVTTFVVAVSVFMVIRFAAPVVDATQSARPIAESIWSFSHEPVPIAVYHVNRVQEYGLEFYLNRPAAKYEDGNVPAAEHVVVAAQGTQSQVAQLVPGRRVSYLTSVPDQKLDLFWVK
jgi:hypothetical protein